MFISQYPFHKLRLGQKLLSEAFFFYFLFIDLNQFLREVISLKTLKPNFGGTRELFVQIDQNDSDRLGISSIVIQN